MDIDTEASFAELIALSHAIKRLSADWDDSHAESLNEMVQHRERLLRDLYAGDQPHPLSAEQIEQLLALDAEIKASISEQQQQLREQIESLQRGQSASRTYSSIEND